MTSDRPYVMALIRCIITQAARDGELQLSNRSDRELRGSIRRLMRDIAESEWRAAVQPEHEPKLVQAASRFAEAGEAELAIVMYATALEHWLNGMIEVGLKRRGDGLDQASERDTLADKLTIRWREFFDVDVPEGLQQEILHLARARNDFVHYKWPSRSEQEHAAHRVEAAEIADGAPRILSALDALEDSLVFSGERKRLERVLDEMGLFEVPSG